MPATIVVQIDDVLRRRSTTDWCGSAVSGALLPIFLIWRVCYAYV